MNITKKTMKSLDSEFSYFFMDKYGNDTESPNEDTTHIHIGFDLVSHNHVFRSFKLPQKKEVTMEWIYSKLNTDSTYKNFSIEFGKLLNKKLKSSIDVYPTSYGIGISLWGWKDQIKKVNKIVKYLLDKYSIEYINEYSDANWVYRYRISKKAENIEKLKKVIA